MAKIHNVAEIMKELIEMMNHDHPENSCENNTCEVCAARRHKKMFAATAEFNNSFESSSKFDSLFKKIAPEIERLAGLEYSELLNTIESAKCEKCKKFVFEPSLNDYDCSNCGNGLLCESKVIVTMKPLKEMRHTIQALKAEHESGILKSLTNSVVQICEQKEPRFYDGLIEIEAKVIHYISEPLREHSFGVLDEKLFKISKIQIVPTQNLNCA